MKKYITGLILMFAIVPNVLFAYTAIEGQDQLRVEQNIEDNAYVVGGKVEIDGDILGDLFLAGGELMVSGNVSDNAFISGGNIETKGTFGNDLIIAGGDVRIRGPVHGDLKAVGGNLVLENSGSGDVNIGAGTIRITKEVQIEKDMGIAGDTVIFAGLVKGKADIFTDNLDIDGIIQKDANIRVNSMIVRVGPNAKILGKLSYSAKERIPELEQIATGGATYSPIIPMAWEKGEGPLYGLVSAYVVYRLLFLLVAGSLLLYYFRKSIGKVAAIVRTTPGKSFLNGLLYFILTPIAIVVMFITVIAIPVGFLGLAIYIFSLVFAKLLTLVVFSEVITTKWKSTFVSPWQKWGVFVVLAIILTLVSGIDFIAAIFAFGAMLVLISNTSTKKSSKA